MSMPSDPRPYAGSLSDGRSADAIRVEVSLAQAGIEVRPRGEQRGLVWPYDTLHSAVPLSGAAPDVLLNQKPDGAQTLFVADPAFARALLARAPALSVARQRWQGLRPGLAVLAVVVLVVSAMWAADVSPAKAVARVMPQQSREALGRAVIAGMIEGRKVCETPAGRAALDKLTQRLTARESGRPAAVRVMLVDWGLVNAFAVPGGQIVLTNGLVKVAASPDEVAGVLAHELGHAIELHPEAGVVRAMGLAAATQLIFAGSTGNITNIGLLLTHLRYTRVAEQEADAHALRLLKGAGISPKGFGDFFERLEKTRPLPETVKKITEFEAIRTHPLTKDRITVVRAQPAYLATPALDDADWQALRQACGGAPAVQRVTQVGAPSADGTPMPAPQPSKDEAEAEREIADANKTLQANPDDVPALQKRARAYVKKNDHAAALADYVKALALKPSDPGLHYGHGWSLQNLRRYEEALRAYDEALRLAPNFTNARNSRGNTNRALKRYPAAMQDFDELIRTQPNYIHAYYNRGIVHRDLSSHADAIRDFSATVTLDKDYTAAYTSRGMSHERTGARDKAIADFRAALAAPAKYNNGAWAHRTARERLKALGVDAAR
jgi:predicted Zn-dependent protease